MTSFHSQSRQPTWLLPSALIALSLLPVLAGAARLTSLAAGAPVTPATARFHEMPLPVVFHILGATLFTLCGAFQFSTSTRSRFPGWHRRMGRVAWLGGVVAAVSGLWMTLFYPLHAQQLQGGLLFAARLVVGATMTVALVIALRAILHRRVAEHRAWMVRAYALGQGAGTQVLVMLPTMLILGPFSEGTYDLLMTAGWLINVVVAEWAIRRKPTSSKARQAGPSNLPSPEASIAESAPRGL